MSKPPIIQINKTPVFVSSEIIKPTIRLKTSPLELKTSISSFNLKTNHSITRQIHTSQNSVIKPKEISDKNSSNYNKINDFFENERKLLTAQAPFNRNKSTYRSYLKTSQPHQESYDTLLLEKNEIEFVNKIRDPLMKDNFFIKIKYDKKLNYNSNLSSLKEKQQTLDKSIPMKYLTNFSTNDTPPQISSFLTPSNKAKIQIPIIKSMDKPPKKDQQIIEDQIFQMKNNEIRSSKPKILSNLATREDVGALSKWLDSMVSRLLNEKNLNLQSLFENLQLVYSGCFQEIIRQVSIECFERGQLIQRIWNAYINLFERAIIEQSKEISSMEIEYLKESSRLHKLYQKEIERLNEVLAKTITEKEIAEAEALKLGENFKYAKKKNVQLEKDCIFFKINFENMRTEYNLINEDNIALKSLIEKNMQQEKKNEDVDYILRRMPKREKNISALIYDRSSFKKNRKNNEEKKNENELYQEENIDNVDDELYIEDKAIDTLDLQFLEEKATDTLDLGYNNFEKRGSGLVSDKKKRNDKISSENMVNYDNFKFSTDLENLKVTLQGTQNMLENKDFPNLTKVLSQPDISVDLRDEIIRALKLLSSFQEEIQDLKISLQERENKIEGLIEQKNKNEQELNLLSEEIQELDAISQRLEEEKQSLQNKLNRFKEKSKYEINAKYRTSTNINLIGEEIVSKALKSAGLDPSYSPSTKSEIKKSQFLKLGELDNQSPLFDESAKASKENSFFANLRRQTTRAVKIFLDQEIVNEEVKEEADEYNIEENDNHSKKSEQTIKQIKSSMSLEELRNLNKEEIEKKEENNYIEENSYLESELSELSDLSVDKIKEMQKDRKRYNEHILKSKRKTIGMRLAFLAPSTLQKTFKKTERNYSVNAEIAKTLLEKILEKKLNNKIKNAFSINTVLKLIGQIYTERLSSNQNINNPLYVMIYDLFLNKYGLKKICEVKYFQFMEACLFHLDNMKIRMFARFTRMVEELENDEFNYYISSFKSFDDLGTNGLKIASNTNPNVYVLYEQTFNFLELNIKPNLPSPNYNSILLELDKLVIKDIKGQKVLMDFDHLLARVIDIYKTIKEKIEAHVHDIFHAADLDQDESIEYFEFVILYRHLEKNNFVNKTVHEVFFDQSDVIRSDTGERALSLKKFVSVIMEKNLFSKETQNKFANEFIPDKENPIKKIDDLLINWKFARKTLKLRLILSRSYNNNFQHIIENLDTAISKKSKPLNILWISYRLMEEETKRLVLEKQVESLLPYSFNLFCSIQTEFWEQNTG